MHLKVIMYFMLYGPQIQIEEVLVKFDGGIFFVQEGRQRR